MTTLSQWLRDHGAHHDVVSWAAPYGGDWARAWQECPRGDWLLGVAAKAGSDPRLVVKAGAACARIALDQVPDDERRVLAAIEAAERWCEGHDDPVVRAAARDAVEAAADEARDPATQAAAFAALAAVGAVDEPEQAASAAANAVQAAVFDVGDCAMMSAMGWAQQACADRVRALLEPPTPP